jgi:hypothetical protein
MSEMNVTRRPSTLRRTCEACERQFLHAPVVAAGDTASGERRHVIACSWPCLEVMVCGANNADAVLATR